MTLCEECTELAHPGLVVCYPCLNRIAEERHQEDKIRWAREAEEEAAKKEAEKEEAL